MIQKNMRLGGDCPPDLEPASKGIRQMISEQLARYFKAHACDDTIHSLYDCVIQEVEIALIEKTLAFAEGNQSRAAEILGLNRNTLRKKIQAYTIEGMRAAPVASPKGKTSGKA